MTKFKSIISLILIFLSGASAQARLQHSECPSIDLSAKLPPVRNQGQSGRCYAFVAADMIGYAQGLPASSAVSALDVAVTTLKISTGDIKADEKTVADFSSYKEITKGMLPAEEYSKRRQKYEPVQSLFEEGGGYAPMAILAYQVKSGGLCLEEKLPSEGSVIDLDSYNYIFERFGKALGQSVDEYAYYFVSKKELRFQTSLNTTSINASTDICDTTKSHMDDVFKLTEKMNQTSFQKIETDFNQACGNRQKIKPMKVATRFFNQNPDAGTDRALIENLKNNKPSGISYDPSFLTEGRDSKVLPNSHASLIVGSRWNSKSNSCEFKLRNSWGQDCEIYAAEFRAVCEKGNIWISADDANARVGRIDLIEK